MRPSIWLSRWMEGRGFGVVVLERLGSVEDKDGLEIIGTVPKPFGRFVVLERTEGHLRLSQFSPTLPPHHRLRRDLSGRGRSERGTNTEGESRV